MDEQDEAFGEEEDKEGDEEEEEEEEGDEEEGDNEEEAEEGGDEVEPSEDEVVETAVRAALKAELKSCKLPEGVALLASYTCGTGGDITFDDPFKLRCADVEATLAAGGAGAVVRMRYHSCARNCSYEFFFNVSWRPSGPVSKRQKPWRLLARAFQREALHTGDYRIDEAPETYAVEVHEAAVPMAAELASKALRAAVFGEASTHEVDDKALLRLVLASVGALRCEKPLGLRSGYAEGRKEMDWLSVAVRAATGQPGARDAAFAVEADASDNWRKADWGERVYERCELDEE